MTLLRVVDRDGVEHEVEAKTGLKVMENLRELDYGVAAICGGMCSCATCHVYIDPDWQARLPAGGSVQNMMVARHPTRFAGRNLMSNRRSTYLTAGCTLLPWLSRRSARPGTPGFGRR